MQEKKIISLIFIVTNFSFFYITPKVFSFPLSVFPFLYYLLRAELILFSFFLVPVLYSLYVKSIKHKYKQSIAAVGILFLLLFYVAELFLTFYPETNGTNNTYCSKTWMYYYWKQNKQGFRDIEFQTMLGNGKHNIVFVGDSYTQGHGIKNPKDRVSDLCRKAFPDFNIFNLGKNGMDINNEVRLITTLPIHPDVIVLQICSNDWDYLIPQNKSVLNTDNKLLLAAFSDFSCADYSILLNYLKPKLGNIAEKLLFSDLNKNEIEKIYTTYNIDKLNTIKSRNNLQVLEYAVSHSGLPYDSIQNRTFEVFKQFNSSLKVLTDSSMFNRYLDKLEEVKLFCEQRQVSFIVIPYPAMDKFSMTITERYINPYLCNLISGRGIKCLDIYPALKKANLDTYTVNNSDNHINEKASKIVADTLVNYLRHNL